MKTVALFMIVVSMTIFVNGKKNDEILTFKTAYAGAELSDAFSSIFYAGSGVVLAGKRSNTYGHRIYRSADHGYTWDTTPEPSGYSGAHVYFFDKNNATNVIITGTGDTGSPCLLRSTDMGQTWNVVLSASDASQLAGRDPNAIFSPLSVGGNRWIACFRNADPGKHIIESTDDGVSWHSISTPTLKAGCRRMILTSMGHILCAGCFNQSNSNRGLYLSQDKGTTWIQVIDNWDSFAGLAELQKGVYLAGSFHFASSSSKISSVKRVNNRVYVTLDKVMDSVKRFEIGSMSDPTMNIDSSVEVTYHNATTFSYPSVGPDVKERSENTGVILPESPCTIYRSQDAGASWNKVATVVAYSKLTYVREIRYLGNGLVYAFVAGNENSWADRALQVYRSQDYGVTWEHITQEIYVGKYGRLNSVYQTALTDTNTLVAATQPDSDIIIHVGPFH